MAVEVITQTQHQVVQAAVVTAVRKITQAQRQLLTQVVVVVAVVVLQTTAHAEQAVTAVQAL